MYIWYIDSQLNENICVVLKKISFLALFFLIFCRKNLVKRDKKDSNFEIIFTYYSFFKGVNPFLKKFSVKTLILFSSERSLRSANDVSLSVRHIMLYSSSESPESLLVENS